MGSIRVRARTIGVFLLGVHLSTAAVAAERISMPFDCRFDGARVELAPSPERSYTILGAHESEIFSACSPADPNRCRSWFVHRFDLDCNGARVAWLDVAEAAMRYYDRPGWVENGSFHVRMGPLWTFEGGDALRDGERRWMHADEGPRGALGGYEAERPYRDARVVTLPPGYAPARGIPVSFSGAVDEPAPITTAAVPQTEAPAAPVAYAAPPEPNPEPIPELPQRAPRSEIAAAQAKSVPAAPVPETAPEPLTKLAMAETAKPAVAAATANDAPVANNAAVAEAAPAAKPPAVTIINGPQSSPPAKEPEEAEQPAAAEPEPQPEATADISTGSTKPAVEAVVAAADPVPSETAPITSVTPPAPGKTIITPTTVVAALALALAALAATMGFRRRTPELVHVTPPAGRDYGSISLGGLRAAGPSQSASLTLTHEPQPVAAGSAGDSLSLVVAPDFPVPSTYEQALDVLGASPDASLAAIKKIVDGLRQNWHPDHARSEADRVYRESRSRQINVAWDLVSQHRPAA